MLKRIGLILAGVVLGVLALGVGVRVKGVVSKAGEGEAGAAAAAVPLPTCSNASLNGNYLFTSTGTRSEGGQKPEDPYQMSGILNFDGKGRLAAVIIQKWGGDTGGAPQLSGTYTIISNCKGKFTLKMAPNMSWTYVMVVGGNEAHFYAEDLTATVGGSMKKF